MTAATRRDAQNRQNKASAKAGLAYLAAVPSRRRDRGDWRAVVHCYCNINVLRLKMNLIFADSSSGVGPLIGVFYMEMVPQGGGVP